MAHIYKAGKSSGRIDVFMDSGGKWRWRVRARNGQITETAGQSYASRSNALRAAKRRSGT